MMTPLSFAGTFVVNVEKNPKSAVPIGQLSVPDDANRDSPRFQAFQEGNLANTLLSWIMKRVCQNNNVVGQIQSQHTPDSRILVREGSRRLQSRDVYMSTVSLSGNFEGFQGDDLLDFEPGVDDPALLEGNGRYPKSVKNPNKPEKGVVDELDVGLADSQMMKYLDDAGVEYLYAPVSFSQMSSFEQKEFWKNHFREEEDDSGER